MSNGQRIVVVPRNNPINAFTMGGIARDAGLSVEQFRRRIVSKKEQQMAQWQQQKEKKPQ